MRKLGFRENGIIDLTSVGQNWTSNIVLEFQSTNHWILLPLLKVFISSLTEYWCYSQAARYFLRKRVWWLLSKVLRLRRHPGTQHLWLKTWFCYVAKVTLLSLCLLLMKKYFTSLVQRLNKLMLKSYIRSKDTLFKR